MTQSQTSPEVSYVRLELFPAAVTHNDTPIPITNLKAVVTDAYLILYIDSPDGPIPHTQEELISFTGTNKKGYTAQTPQGTYLIKRSRGCGCGSRLRGFHPFRGKPYRGGEYV